MKTGMRIEGFEEADQNLARLVEVAEPNAMEALARDALRPVAETARRIVRRDTGRLARSIRVGSKLSPAQAAMTHVEPGTVEAYVGPGSMPQAITEEFGRVGESAHPFMRPAWDANVRAVVDRLQQGAADRLARIAES